MERFTKIFKESNDIVSDSDRFLKTKPKYKDQLNKFIKFLKSKNILAKHLFRLDFVDFPIVTLTGNYKDIHDYQYCYEEIKNLLPKATTDSPMLIDFNINDL